MEGEFDRTRELCRGIHSVTTAVLFRYDTLPCKYDNSHNSPASVVHRNLSMNKVTGTHNALKQTFAVIYRASHAKTLRLRFFSGGRQKLGEVPQNNSWRQNLGLCFFRKFELLHGTDHNHHISLNSHEIPFMAFSWDCAREWGKVLNGGYYEKQRKLVMGPLLRAYIV